MLKQLLFAVVLVVSLTCVSAQTQPEVMHTVIGTITAPDGSPVANASVEAVRILGENSRGSAGQLTWTPANSRGRFRIRLLPGRYQIRAKREADGYPDPNFLLSVDPSANFPEVSVDLADISEVKVTLGGKGGILEGELRDQATHDPVVKAKVTISDARRPQVFVEVFADKNGHFQFTVPSKPVLISAMAPEYRMTYFRNGEELTLSEGERRIITLELEHQ